MKHEIMEEERCMVSVHPIYTQKNDKYWLGNKSKENEQRKMHFLPAKEWWLALTTQ